MATISHEIFKTYDIRGIVDKTLTDEATYLIGEAIAAKTAAQNISKTALGHDGRVNGPELAERIQYGFADSGIDMPSVGMAATPILYYAAINERDGGGVIIAGSHNPPDYSGFKIIFGGDTLAGPVIQKLLAAVEVDHSAQPATKGSVIEKGVSIKYRDCIVGHVKLKRPIKIIIDTGNDMGDAPANALYRALGNEVTELFSKVDSAFPHYHPNPSELENPQDLIVVLRNNDVGVGLAFDGDVDHLGVAARGGGIIYPSRQLMLFSQDVLSRNLGARAIFDVKSTRLFTSRIKEYGSEPIMGKAGHSFIKSTMKKTGILIAGEMSGHIFFKERWFDFDDGMYAGARLLETLSTFDNPTEVLDSLPQSISTPELNIDLPEGSDGHQVIEELVAKVRFEGATEIITIDDLRVEFPDGFDLMCVSNTTPISVLYFEVDSDEAIERIQNQFKAVIENNSALKWPL